MGLNDKVILDLFMNLFSGRRDVWGGVEGVSIKEPVTEEHYRLHLEGKKSLGIYPLFDDGYCHFFACDLDEKNWDKIVSIRTEMALLGIAMYICESKSKGFHIYGFSNTPAVDIRFVLKNILTKLKMPKIEIFPKQDKVDEKIPYGNYINLPCFGNTRHFQTIDHKPLTTAEALPRIQRTNLAIILKARDSFPGAPLPPPLPLKEKKAPKSGKKHPPCIEMILKGVPQGSRDEAAFALARHYLDQGYTTDEVTVLLEQWDLRNKPPIGDPKQLKIKADSAAKGYAFGCNSVRNEPLLASFCPGEDRCVWLTEAIKDKKKRGLIREVSMYDSTDILFEQIVSPDRKEVMFLGWNRKTGTAITCKEVQETEITYVPLDCEEIREDAVRLPTGIEEYTNTLSLHDALMEQIKKYVDIGPRFIEFAAWYILMTWVYDKLPTLTYLRWAGDTGCGKSRALDIIGDLCYKPMVLSGAITPAPIYRLIKKFRGTLILDEADFNDSDEKAEVTKILNCGFERSRPVIRCQKDDPDDLQVLPTFGPKVFATRFRFQDVALEARCLTYTMEETDREDIPPYLNTAYHKIVYSLRNQLLLWRFRNRDKIDPDKTSSIIDLDTIGERKIEPRLKQTCVPFGMIFSELPETVDRFRTFIHDYNEDLIRERYDSNQGRVVYAYFKAAQSLGRAYVTSGAVSKICLDELKLDLKPRRIAGILKSMNLHSDKCRIGGKQGRFLQWNEVQAKKLFRRYIPGNDEFMDLFDGTDPTLQPPLETVTNASDPTLQTTLEMPEE